MMKTYLRILEELGWPNIYLVSPQQFEQIEGETLHGYFGVASDDYPVVSINKGLPGGVPVKNGLRGRALRNTIYHEIAHHLFPYRKHWWIECFGEKMAGGGGRGIWSEKYDHTVDDLPSRLHLLKLARRASKRFNEKHKRRVSKSKRLAGVNLP